jgi:SAM-dependent methyltransferase
MALIMAYGSHALMAPDSDWLRRLRRIGIFRSLVMIPVGSNIPRVEVNNVERVKIREKLCGPSNGFLLGAFGASHDRDIRIILDGLQRLKMKWPVKLVWIGATGLNEASWLQIKYDLQERGLEDEVLWTGLLPHPEVSRLLSVCDILTLPFNYGISTRRTSAVTALQHGLPLLTTRSEQVDPCLIHAENIYLVPIGDGKTFGDGLLELAHRPDLCARLAEGARVLHDAYFDWDVIAREVVRAVVKGSYNTIRPWSWGLKVTEQLLWEGLETVKTFFQGDLLDIGCGMKPYQPLLGQQVRRWIGLDFAITPSGHSKADVFGSALALPFKTECFDAVLCTEVLEHVPRPDRLFQEAYRVLKPGRPLVLTAPQTSPLHEEPHDYFRYTGYSLRFLAEQAGFHVVEVKPLGGAITTVCQMLVWHLNWLRRIPLLGSGISKFVNASLAWMALKLDWLSPIYGGGAIKSTLNWLLVARKPESC